MAGSPDSPEARLARKVEELETTLRSLSHDLRSPLVSLLGFARLLREEYAGELGRTGGHFLDRIEQAGRHMERLLDDLLALSRIEDTPNVPVHVRPERVLEQLAAELKLTLDAADIELVLPADPPVVVCDRTRLYQLFSNLVGNAIHHMARGPGHEADPGGRIEVRITDEGDGWRLEVEDDGPGIAEADQERIFQPFETAGTRGPAPKKKASGLGLAIVRKIVDAHRGRVWVENAPAGGARFVVWLPRPQDDVAEDTPGDATGQVANA